MLDSKHMVIVTEDGEEVEVEIVLTFNAPDNSKQFVLVADPEDEDAVLPFIYTDGGELEEVSDPDELRMCEEVLGAFSAEETDDDL